MSIQELDYVVFPKFSGLKINMMPIVMGDPASVPSFARPYLPMIGACPLRKRSTVYLTVHESIAHGIQRRGGVHTDATADVGWGGGWGGSGKGLGICLSSTDGACRAWDTDVTTTDDHGAVPAPVGPAVRLEPQRLYLISDRTPHESLPSCGLRQFFRLVGDSIGGWWKQHSTPSPLGIQPNAPILTGNKFASGA